MNKKTKKISSASLINEIVILCKIHRFSCKIIGYEKFEKIKQEYPLYKIVINPKAKISFCIIAGVHGDEIAGPFTVIDMLKKPKIFDDKIRYDIFPLINPTGFDLRRRYNDDNRDLNCLNKKTLKSKNYRELKAFNNSTKNDKFDALISLHEDLSQTKFYAYIYEKEKNPLYRRIISLTEKTVNIWKTKNIYENFSDCKGLATNAHDQSIEDRLYRQGRAKISLTTETPGKLPLKKRIKINLNNIKTINKYLINNIK
ncbi:succinylglutamate desuccinylase/aspartoacylase family protein [Patescibacteria group bacterium]|nr:succinylglutamate desuccinylase/aspartoacylase family protein [Patescibacteria group bacterium]MBU4601224.1 succinylglutamate desuccinylase/aspartoacylase family protein [Patescibacteria group bacterium]MCG2697617.1 succinylglutamate desuccinylase/aspartoacylase family protein [Candidatus Parcubacteria bacterium]